MDKRAILLILGTLLLAAAPAARADNPYLVQGVEAYENFEYKQALDLLEQAATHPGSSDEEKARVHLYLGFTRMTLGDRPMAERDFAKALQLDYHIELPQDLSPKIVAVFDKIKETIPPPAVEPPPDDTGGDGGVTGGGGGSGRPPEVVVRTRTGPRVWTWVLTGVGLAALAGGGTFGYLASSAKDDFDNEPYADEADKLRDTIDAHSLAANILFGVGGASLVAALVLFFTEGETEIVEEPPAAAVRLAPGGVEATFRF